MKTMRISDEFLNQIKKSIVLPLQLDNSHYNRGVFVIGDYKARRLISLVASVAEDADNLNALLNAKLANELKPIAGKFKVIRVKSDFIRPFDDIIRNAIDGADLSRTEHHIEMNERLDPWFAGHQIKDDYSTHYKDYLIEKGRNLAASSPNKGYLFVIEDIVPYLIERFSAETLQQDLFALRDLGEICTMSNIRCIVGMRSGLNNLLWLPADLAIVRARFSELNVTDYMHNNDRDNHIKPVPLDLIHSDEVALITNSCIGAMGESGLFEVYSIHEGTLLKFSGNWKSDLNVKEVNRHLPKDAQIDEESLLLDRKENWPIFGGGMGNIFVISEKFYLELRDRLQQYSFAYYRECIEVAEELLIEIIARCQHG